MTAELEEREVDLFDEEDDAQLSVTEVNESGDVEVEVSAEPEPGVDIGPGIDPAAEQEFASETGDPEIDKEIASLAVDETPCHTMSPKARAKLETKKRLDAYRERQRLKDSGWDDDDELFDDEYFREVESGLRARFH